MQLKLSVGDEMLTIDVKSTDTFQDISDRLCSLLHIKVDMNQLRSSNNDKPFDMATNVIEYFTKESKCTSPAERQKSVSSVDKRSSPQCRLCGDVIHSTSHSLFGDSLENDVTLADKINSALPIHVSEKDSHPKHVCNNCLGHLDESYDFMKTVMDAQVMLESRVKPGEPIRHAHRNGRCPLCNNGVLRQLNKAMEAKNVRKGSSEKGITVSVPKNTNASKTITKRGRTDDDFIPTEYYQSDEVVTGYWEPRKSTSVSSNNSADDGLASTGPKRRYQKRLRSEDDQDWTIDEEYIPVSRRGRPKGTKNKPKVVSVVQRTCVLCDWTGADLDMLAHTINFHCQPDLGYFPCPMCKTRHSNEMVLEAHIEEHNMALRK